MSYKAYYQRAIAAHDRGLKYVIGGTGLGKTRGVVETLAEQPTEKKAVYIANRLNLLRALETDINTHDQLGQGSAIMLSKDAEVVYRVFRDHRLELTKFLKTSGFNVDKKHLKGFQKAIREITNLVENTTSGQIEYNLSLELIEPHARTFLRVVQGQMRNAYITARKRWNSWMDLPIVQEIFPYIAFVRRQDARILLVSLHKLFHGFFDGHRKRNGTHLEGFIIFADEFDFLEKDLIDLIANERQIDDPFAFVANFYREYTQHKERRASYPDIDKNKQDIRRRIDEIKALIDELQDVKIQYPAYSQFISTGQDLTNVVLFRTNHTVTSATVYLYQTDRGFDISLHRDPKRGEPFYADMLFRPVASATERILTLLKELEQDQESTADQLKRDWFQHTIFIDQIRRITQYPRKRVRDISPQGSLLKSGFSMYDIYHLDSETDSEQVELRNYTIYMTPESFVGSLAQKNLMFALSATADIRRCVAHFDLDWLRLEGGVNVIEPNDLDRTDIATLNAQKAEQRKNTVRVEQLTPLSAIKDGNEETVQISRGLLSIIERAMQFDELGGGEDTEGKHRQLRLELFFSGVLWAAHQANPPGEPQSHLMFLNTYREIEQFFRHDQTQTSSFHTIEHGSRTKLWESFTLYVHSHRFQVVFYNVDKARKWASLEGAEEEFNALFHGDDPVIVVTQYQSAGNGINLQYTLPNGSKRDFLNLHLLEVPYFYFDSFSEDDSAEKRTATIKKNIWYIAKLHEAKFLSQGEFQVKLAQVHQSRGWNNDYRTHPAMRIDQQRNAAAALIQALGRIERVWNKTPDQTVLLSQEAYFTFERFLSDDHRELTETRQEISSGNLQQVLAYISTEMKQKHKAARRNSDPAIEEPNRICEHKVRTLITNFETIRTGENAPARHKWETLRNAALRHDFADKTIREYRGTFTSPYIADAIFINSDGEIIPEVLRDGGTIVWSLNAAYYPVRANSVIRQHFLDYGYEVNFNPTRRTAFVPYFYQAILTGAIGEEAIRALLREQDIHTESLPDALFEAADLKVKGCPWYVDCKNYADATLGKFALSPGDYGYYHKFDSDYFLKRAIEKWQMLAAQDGPDSRLFFINLASDQERMASYLRVQDGKLQLASGLDDAQIIIIPAAIDSSGRDKYHVPYQRLIDEMKDYVHA